MVYKVKILCVPWFEPHEADVKVWVTFEWTDAPNMGWNPENERPIDHRLIVKFQSVKYGLLKQWKDVTRVNFVKVDGSYKMELFHTLLPLCPSMESPCATCSASKNYIIRMSATSSHHPAIFRCRARGAGPFHTRSKRPAKPRGNG